MIDNLVCEQPGGFEQVNMYLIRAVSEALRATQKQFHQDLGKLQDELGSLLMDATARSTPASVVSRTPSDASPSSEASPSSHISTASSSASPSPGMGIEEVDVEDPV